MEVRVLEIILKRNPEADNQRESTQYYGYEIYWPDGRPLKTAIRQFCAYGTRFLAGHVHPSERLIRLLARDAGPNTPVLPLSRHRTHRFKLNRRGDHLHVLLRKDQPTNISFDYQSDEPIVMSWLAPRLSDQSTQEIDVTVVPLSAALPIVAKTIPCPRCGRDPQCGIMSDKTYCWCAKLPRLSKDTLAPYQDEPGCLCKECTEFLLTQQNRTPAPAGTLS